MWTTEKILDAYLGNTIPIYAGGKAETIFNPDSFINLNNKSEEEIIETIKEVNENDELYKKMYNAPILLDENYFKKKYEEIEQFLVNLVEKILWFLNHFYIFCLFLYKLILFTNAKTKEYI